MFKFNRRIKLNKIILNITKSFVMLLFAFVLFDKINFTYIKDIVVKLDAERIYANYAKLALAMKTLSFDLSILFSFFMVVFNIICVTNIIILLILFIKKIIANIETNINFKRNFSYSENSYQPYSNIYLINETFRC